MTNALAYTRWTSCHAGQHNKYRHAEYNNTCTHISIIRKVINSEF